MKFKVGDRVRHGMSINPEREVGVVVEPLDDDPDHIWIKVGTMDPGWTTADCLRPADDPLSLARQEAFNEARRSPEADEVLKGLLREVLAAPVNHRGVRGSAPDVPYVPGAPDRAIRYTAKRLPDTLLDRIEKALEV